MDAFQSILPETGMGQYTENRIKTRNMKRRRDDGNMNQYERIVSYIYQYRQGEKGANVGYARVEQRAAACRISIQMRAIPVKSTPKVYVYQQLDRTIRAAYAGNMTIRGSNLLFKGSSSAENLFQSSLGLDEIDGILIDTEDDSFFATSWTKDFIRLGNWKANTTQEQKNLVNTKKITPKPEQASDPKKTEQKSKNSPNTDKTTQQQENPPNIHKSIQTVKNSSQIPLKEKQTTESTVQTPVQQKNGQDSKPKSQKKPQTAAAKNANPEKAAEIGQKQEKKEIPDTKSMPQPPEKKEESNQPLPEKNTPQNPVPQETIQETAMLQQEYTEQKKAEQEETEQEKTETDLQMQSVCNVCPFKRNLYDYGKRILMTFPSMQPFQGGVTKSCVRMELQDIGCLPIASWSLSGNRFLLHGYYCYRHLLFAQLINGRYVLGVPGIYSEKERKNALRFGFSDFQSIGDFGKQQGAFGYWFLELPAENQLLPR